MRSHAFQHHRRPTNLTAESFPTNTCCYVPYVPHHIPPHKIHSPTIPCLPFPSRTMLYHMVSLSFMFTHPLKDYRTSHTLIRRFFSFAVRRSFADRHDKKVLELYGAVSLVNFPLSALVDPATARVLRLRTSSGREIPLAPEKTKVHTSKRSRYRCEALFVPTTPKAAG